MRVKMEKKQTYKNLITNIAAFGLQFVISFYISPAIVQKAGATAYGFIGIANDFVSYASILATVFNSVAARFISTAIYSGDYKKAKGYFNSLLVTDILISGFWVFIGLVFIPNLERILSIPAELVYDVKLTFLLIFASYIVSLTTSVFTVSTFVTNRLDIQGFRNIINYVIRLLLIILFLNCISVRIFWVAAATLGAEIIVAVMNIRLTKVLTPELSLNTHYIDKSYVFELARSGCWMALTSISNILMRGLDLTIANLALGSYDMGLLSVARTFPNSIMNAVGILAPIFTPVFVSLYTSRRTEALVFRVKHSILVMSLIFFVPVSGFIVFARDFYSLWQESLAEQEITVVTLLSSLTVIQTYFDCITSTMAQLSVVVNKLRMPVFVSLGCGILSLFIEIALIKYTGLGVYAIVISTTILLIIRYLFFNSFYASHCLGQPLLTFFPTVLKVCAIIPILIFTMELIHRFMPVGSWIGLCRAAVICATAGFCEMFLFYKLMKKVIMLQNAENER